MFIASENNKTAQQKMFLHGLENLLELGGFIKEQVEDEIYELYPEIVVEKVEKYCPVGSGFWEVADAVENAYKEKNKYADYVFDEQGEPFEISDPIFDEWVIDQVARITTEKYKNDKGCFWGDWKLTRETRKLLTRLNALDERILYLSRYGGSEDHQKLTAEQIAELPEFSCNEKYIDKVMEVVEDTLNRCEWGDEEFTKVCDEHRSR